MVVLGDDDAIILSRDSSNKEFKDSYREKSSEDVIPPSKRSRMIISSSIIYKNKRLTLEVNHITRVSSHHPLSFVP